MTTDEIKQARAVCEAATPGPWAVETRHPSDPRRIVGPAGESIAYPVSPKHAAFIAAARTGWPAALDALEDAESRAKAWKAQAEGMAEVAKEAKQSRAREAQVERELREAVGLLRMLLASSDIDIGEQDDAAEFVSRFDEEAERG